MTYKHNRGLASASKETRERVAREGGKASHGMRSKAQEDEEESYSFLDMR